MGKKGLSIAGLEMKECGWSLEAQEVQEMDSSLHLQKENKN